MSILRRCCFGGVLVALGQWALAQPQSTFDTVGPVAEMQLDLFMLTFWLAIGVFVLVAGALGYAVWRFRARSQDARALPPQTHGNTILEVSWTIAPAILLIVIGIPTVRTIWQLEQRHFRDEEVIEVNATGHQWWWAFEYPDLGIVTANELHIPTGTRIHLNLRSEDVIHSFWVPRIAGKKDLIPNQDNSLWIKSNEVGNFYGQCAEFCQTAHAHMRFRVIARPPEEFDAWAERFGEVSSAPQQVSSNPLVSQGKELFKQKGCAGCHTVEGYSEGKVGPSLTDLGDRTTIGAGILPNTEENLAAWLRNPQALKPGNYMPTLWREDDPHANEEIEALVAYLHSLHSNGRMALQDELHDMHEETAWR